MKTAKQIVCGIKNGYSKFLAAVSIFTSICLMFCGIVEIDSTQPQKEVKNVIVMIGDGMGENHLEKTKNEVNVSLIMETLPLRGQSQTNNIWATTTDSAAGATALACGVRTNNGAISAYVSDPLMVSCYPKTLTELAMENGMKTGIVTSDSTAGATPAAFSSHATDRDESEKISKQQLSSGIDLIWGAPCGDITEQAVQNAGYTFINDRKSMNVLKKDEKSFGQFNTDLWRIDNTDSDVVTLSSLTSKAIELLDNENGFFLMIEGAHIDKHSHSNRDESMTEALLEFDRAVGLALNFAMEDGETLLVITADHETGAIQYANGKYSFTSGSHSNANVPLFVYGDDDFINNGEAVKNRSIAEKIARSWGFAETEFPKKMEKKPDFGVLDKFCEAA